MNLDEFAQSTLNRILEVGHQTAEPAAERMSKIVNDALGYYHSVLRTKLSKQTNLVVQSGPFAGMRCITSAILPRLIGSYEAELHDTIHFLARRVYSRVVNIGCGEGYYAVGLARLMPAAQVFALDAEPLAQSSCRSMAEQNGVSERVMILGKCTLAMLNDLARPDTLILCDCEGDELTLLDPVAVPALSMCDLLVEMHDFISPDTSSTLQERFRASHSATIIPQASRDPLAYPILESFTDFDRLLALCEFRPGPTPWGLFLSNSRVG